MRLRGAMGRRQLITGALAASVGGVLLAAVHPTQVLAGSVRDHEARSLRARIPDGSLEQIPEGVPPDLAYSAYEQLMDAGVEIATPPAPPISFTRVPHGWFTSHSVDDVTALFRVEADRETVHRFGPYDLAAVNQPGTRLVVTRDNREDGDVGIDSTHLGVDADTGEVYAERDSDGDLFVVGFATDNLVVLSGNFPGEDEIGTWLWDLDSDELTPVGAVPAGYRTFGVGGGLIFAEREVDSERRNVVVELERDERCWEGTGDLRELSADGQFIILESGTADPGQPTLRILDAATGEPRHDLYNVGWYQLAWEDGGDLLLNLRPGGENALVRYRLDTQTFELATPVENDGYEDIPGPYLLDTAPAW